MLKSVLIGAVSLLLHTHTAAQANSEEMAQIEVLEEITHRVPLQKKAAPGFDKYSDFVDRTTNYTPTKSYFKMLNEKIWGKDRHALRFEKALDDYETWKHRQAGPRGAKKRLGVAEAQAQLHQAEGGAMFHGPLHFGTSQTEFDMIYDTGSDWVVVEGKNCTNCQGNTYDPASSSQSKQVGQKVSSRQYGSAVLLGTEFTDKVCVNSFQACVDNFQYFQITVNQTGLSEPFDGILGMARNKPFLLGGNTTTSAVGPLFVDALAANKVIQDPRFSFSLGYKNDTFVDFGTPQSSAMSNQNDIRDIYVENDFFWSAYSQGIAFKNTSMDSSFGYVNGSMVYSLFDTGSAGILLSSDYFETIVNKLFQDYLQTQNFVIKDGVVFSQCFPAQQLPTLYFLFNELWIELLGIDYMADVSPAKDRSLCQLQIFKNPLAFNVFGAPLFRGYYTVHDPANNKIGFVPTPQSPKTRLKIGMLPTNFFDAPLPLETSIWIYVITGVVVVGLACLYYFVIIPELKKVISNQMLVVLIATVTVAGVAAAYVWGILPLLKKAFGEQTTVDSVDPSSLKPSVGASQQTSVFPIILTFGVVFFLLKSIFTPKPVASTAKPAPAFDFVASNNLL